MNVICIDDEKLALQYLEIVLKKIPRIKKINCFNMPQDGMDFLKNNPVDVVFLDIELYVDSGLEIAKKIKALYPQIHIIFLTAYSQYAVQAFKTRASGYLLKPVMLEDVIEELNHLRTESTGGINRLSVQTFGNFEVYCDGVPLKFARKKSKELFAYLVYKRGTPVDIAELIINLWEDKEVNSLGRSMIHNVIADLNKTLLQEGLDDIFLKNRNSYRIDPAKIDCDFYRFLDGDKNAIHAFSGEFMENYNWAMYTSSFLQEKVTNDGEK